MLGSRRVGGMDAFEAVPFSSKENAVAFVNKEGGVVQQFSSIPENYILGEAAN